MPMVITISRRYGTGASRIAQYLSEQLQLPVYDRTFVEHEAKAHDFAAESELLRELAREPGIFLGRCAGEILKDVPDALHIFVSATKEDRISRIMEKEQISLEEAKKAIEENDKARAEYFFQNTGKVWGDVANYHMILDTSQLGIEACGPILMRYFEKMEYI